MEDKSIKPFEELTSDEVEKLRQNVKKRLESAMSLYFSNHPEEFKKL